MRFDPEISKQVGANRTSDQLGPGTLSCSFCTCWQMSPPATDTNKRLKITSCLCSWGKLQTIRYKKTTNQLLLPRGWKQQQRSPTHDSCTGHYQEGSKTTKAVCPAIPTCPSPTSLHLRNQPSLLGEPSREPDICLNFSSGLLPISVN